MTAKEKDKLGALQKRLDWLNTRIYKEANDSKDLSYDRSEAGALAWAIESLEVHVLKTKEEECKHYYALLQTGISYNDGHFSRVFCVKCLKIANIT